MAVLSTMKQSAIFHLILVSIIVFPSQCFVICNSGMTKTSCQSQSIRPLYRGPHDNRPSSRDKKHVSSSSGAATTAGARPRSLLPQAWAWMRMPTAVGVEESDARRRSKSKSGFVMGLPPPSNAGRRRMDGRLHSETTGSSIPGTKSILEELDEEELYVDENGEIDGRMKNAAVDNDQWEEEEFVDGEQSEEGDIEAIQVADGEEGFEEGHEYKRDVVEPEEQTIEFEDGDVDEYELTYDESLGGLGSSEMDAENTVESEDEQSDGFRQEGDGRRRMGVREAEQLEEEGEVQYASYHEWDGVWEDDGGDQLFYLTKLEPHLAGIEDIDKPPPIRGDWEITSFSEGDEFDFSNFSQCSFHVDLGIGIGNIDEQKKERIQPALRVLGNIADLIDTTDDIFSFKYFGLIKNQVGIEAWARKMITDCYPDTKDVKMITNRTRDLRDT